MWINIYTIFAQYLPKYAGKFLHILCNRVNFQRSSRCFLTNLHGWQEFYTTAGRTGRAKYQLCFYHQWIIGSKLIHIRSDTDCNRWVLVLKHSGSPQSTGLPWQVWSSFLFLRHIPHESQSHQCIWVNLKMLADFGYDISSYVDIDPIFGTLQDFDLLSAAAKVRFNRGWLCEEEEKCSNILLVESSCQLVGWSSRFTRVRSVRWSH